MRIGILSDTHMPSEGTLLPPQVARAFAGVDLILHAGDLKTTDCLDQLERIAPVLAVELAPSPCLDDPRVAAQRVMELEGYSIGMVHDLLIRGIGWEIIPGMMEKQFPKDWSFGDRLADVFGQPIHIVVHGHTHAAMVETFQDILIVNPGSPTLPNQVRRLGQVAILELTPAGAAAKIVNLTDY